MREVTVDQASVCLADLVEEADHGEDVVIYRDGEPVARLASIRNARPLRITGISISECCDSPIKLVVD